MKFVLSLCLALLTAAASLAQDVFVSPFACDDPKPQAYYLSERASKIDPRVADSKVRIYR